jgi:farnesyl diphosphate synthase
MRMEPVFRERLKATQEAVAAALRAALRGECPGVKPPLPGRLLDAVEYAALGPGKRLRPFIVIEAARLFGAEGDGVVRAAAALECIHCYSLVHDDLPAMDDDDLRRGRPTVHKAFDEATAILVGDALQSLAFAILADPATDPDTRVRAELVLGLANAAGAAGMAGGQMLDLTAESRALDEAEVAEMQAMKTGALFRYAAEAGAILGRAKEAERMALVRYGAALGAAFQLADDLIDVTGDAATAGKATAKDAGMGKATLVALRGVDGARARLGEEVAAAVAELAPFGSRAAVLVELARFVAAAG